VAIYDIDEYAVPQPTSHRILTIPHSTINKMQVCFGVIIYGGFAKMPLTNPEIA
jgi:hypothetical protein